MIPCQMVGGIADGKMFVLLDNNIEWCVAHSPDLSFIQNYNEKELPFPVRYKVDVYRRMINAPHIFMRVRTEDR